ncbi:unnamed protein product [Rhodiola kirilowii]
MSLSRIVKWVVVILVLSFVGFVPAMSEDLRWAAKKERMKEKVRKMFYHAYDNYMAHAFPHDELKPFLKLEHLPQDYNGSALSLIESLSSLVIMGNNTEFGRAVLWLSDNLNFDVDARVNLFECNIRNQLLNLAEDLGRRFLPAFETPTGLPYAWVNLKYGVIENETTETSSSGCGSLILEMGALSRLTGDPRYESAALRALRRLWSMRSSLNLLGTTLDVETGEWIEFSSESELVSITLLSLAFYLGCIAYILSDFYDLNSVDSFYEYLIKAHILFGRDEYWRMFHSAYLAVQKYFRHGPWYHEADMRTGKATYWQLTSLQAFWPGMQVLIGDVPAANLSHREFFHVWEKFGVLPERYLLDHQMVHPTEKYYPLRPELAESTFYLYQATKDPWYMEVGESMVNSLNLYTKVEGGFASVKDVSTMVLEDHQHSFFLAETCKDVHFNELDFHSERETIPTVKCNVITVCPATTLDHKIESACHITDNREDHRCLSDDDCGVDSTNCRRRSCSVAGYCGLWLFI